MKYILISCGVPSVEVSLALWLIQKFGRTSPIGFRNARVIYYWGDQPPAPANLQNEVLVLDPGCLIAGKGEGRFLSRLLLPPSVSRFLQTQLKSLKGEGLFSPHFSQGLVRNERFSPVLFREIMSFLDTVLGEKLRLAIALTESYHASHGADGGKRSKKGPLTL